jgi:hypothetical protein
MVANLRRHAADCANDVAGRTNIPTLGDLIFGGYPTMMPNEIFLLAAWLLIVIFALFLIIRFAGFH